MRISQAHWFAAISLVMLAACGEGPQAVSVLDGAVRLRFPAGWKLEQPHRNDGATLNHSRFWFGMASCFVKTYLDETAKPYSQADQNERVAEMTSEILKPQLPGTGHIIAFDHGLLANLAVVNFEAEQTHENDTANLKGREFAIALSDASYVVMVFCAGAPNQGERLKGEINSILNSLEVTLPQSQR